MDYYSTLGIPRGSSDEDIKKAYRSLAMKHHPDRGGDERKFKEISTAYEVLSDPNKKQIFEMGGDPNSQQFGGGHQSQNPFAFHFNTGNFGDIFSQFGFGQQPHQRNQSLNIGIEVTLEEVLKGKEVHAEVTLPSGKKKMINISIPTGIENGQQIRYQGMGDDSIPGISAGDLIVNITVRPHSRFKREGTSLIYEREITVWDALLGTKLDIANLENKNLSITVPAGTQFDTILSCKGEGVPQLQSTVRGNLLIKIKITIPKTLTQGQITKIQSLKSSM